MVFSYSQISQYLRCPRIEWLVFAIFEDVGSDVAIRLNLLLALPTPAFRIR